MANTRQDVAVPAGTWTDLYAGSGAAAGTAVTVYNKGTHDCRLAVGASAPASTSIGIPLYVGPVGSSQAIAAGASGLWAYSEKGSILLVQD